MIEWFFLDRIDAETAGPAIGGQHDFIAFAGADEAKSALIFAQPAKPGTQITLQPSVIMRMPVPAGNALDQVLIRCCYGLLRHIDYMGVSGGARNANGTILVGRKFNQRRMNSKEFVS